MRTTLNLDDDVLAVARALADRKGGSLGGAVSELARRGFTGARPSRHGVDGTVFDVLADAAPITSDDVHGALDDWP